METTFNYSVLLRSINTRSSRENAFQFKEIRKCKFIIWTHSFNTFSKLSLNQNIKFWKKFQNIKLWFEHVNITEAREIIHNCHEEFKTINRNRVEKDPIHQYVLIQNIHWTQLMKIEMEGVFVLQDDNYHKEFLTELSLGKDKTSFKNSSLTLERWTRHKCKRSTSAKVLTLEQILEQTVLKLKNFKIYKLPTRLPIPIFLALKWSWRRQENGVKVMTIEWELVKILTEKRLKLKEGIYKTLSMIT